MGRFWVLVGSWTIEDYFRIDTESENQSSMSAERILESLTLGITVHHIMSLGAFPTVRIYDLDTMCVEEDDIIYSAEGTIIFNPPEAYAPTLDKA